MIAAEVECPKCHSHLLADKFSFQQERACFGCGNTLDGVVFPAIYQANQPKATLSNPATGEDAVCFYRADQRATAVCSKCGVFVSEMYRVRIGDDDYCTNCVAKSQKDSSIPALVTRATLRDHQALAMALIPLIFVFPVVVTAPMALYYVIRYWKHPGGIVKRSRWRMVLAAILAVIEIAACIYFAFDIWQETL